MSNFLNDKAVERLRIAGALPEFSGTRYILQEFLARGGMGTVYTAEDKTLNRRVAIKILDSSDLHGALEERLLREARVLAKLEHPGIVPVHDAGTLPDGRVFYVMKFVEGSRVDQSVVRVLINLLPAYRRCQSGCGFFCASAKPCLLRIPAEFFTAI